VASFDLAIPRVLVHEGGYSSDASDPGGETNFGIAKRSHPEVDIKNLTVDQAKEIYRKDYWQFDAIADQAVGGKLLDMSVQFGRGTAIEMLEEVLQKLGHAVKIDGLLDPHLVDAVNTEDAGKLLTYLRARCAVRYAITSSANQATRKFLFGWMLRAQE
jgi:lysozyme family protein